MSVTIGKKLKHFRKRAGLSQFELEIKIDASNGSLSRIESGETNPSKETILKIAEVLNLNPRELDYMIGLTSTPVTEKEVEKAVYEVRDLFSKNTIAYLIDERWRMWSISPLMLKILGLDKNYIESTFGISTINYLTDPEVGILNIFSEERYREMLEDQLKYFYMEVGFMKGDEHFEKAVEGIMRNEIAAPIWDRIVSENDTSYSIIKGRYIYFKILGKFEIPFRYIYEPMLSKSRFTVVEWVPDNKFLKLVSRFIA